MSKVTPKKILDKFVEQSTVSQLKARLSVLTQALERVVDDLATTLPTIERNEEELKLLRTLRKAVEWYEQYPEERYKLAVMDALSDLDDWEKKA